MKVVKAKKLNQFLILSLLVLTLFGSSGYFALAQTDKPKSWTPWQPPALVLPHAGSPFMLVNSLDGSASYVSSTKSYGVVAGNEFRNWTNSTHIKIGDHTQPDNAQQARATFDEVGTLHAVWGGRSETGTFNVYYNRVLNGTQVNNVSVVPRNLTREIYGTNERPTGKPSIAYSREFHTLYLLIIERKTGNLDDVLLTESTDEGTTWSTPQKVGVTGQFDPARTSAVLLTDKNENLHIITAPNGTIVHRVMTGGVLGEEKTVISGSERNFAINAAKAPNGDIWLSWADGQEYGVHAAKWSGGNWTVHKRLNGNGVQGHYPAIAVGEGTGAIWLMWVDRSQGDSTGDGRDLKTMFTVSHDNGNSWLVPQLMFSFTEQNWYRPNDLSATSSRGLIHLAINAYNRDPNRPWDWSLFVTTVPEYYPNQPPPTATPQPTNTATGRPSATATNTAIPNTATATIAAPPTITPLALATNSRQGQAKISPAAKPSDTPAPLANEGANNPTDNTASAPDSPDPKVQATAYALAQAEAAKTPIIVTMPFTNTLSFSGRGPVVLPATATPLPTSTPKPTATTVPTATVKPTLQPTVPLYGAKPVTTTQTVTATKKNAPAKESGDPVPMWLVLPLGLLLAGKGALNLLALRKS